MDVARIFRWGAFYCSLNAYDLFVIVTFLLYQIALSFCVMCVCLFSFFLFFTRWPACRAYACSVSLPLDLCIFSCVALYFYSCCGKLSSLSLLRPVKNVTPPLRGVHSRPLGVHLQLTPINSAPKFFYRPGGAPAPTAPPGYACAGIISRLSTFKYSHGESPCLEDKSHEIRL